MSVSCKKERRPILTYVPGQPNKMPYFIEGKAYQGACGRVYPIPVRDQLSDAPVEVEYDVITLANEHIEVNLLPELGGKVYGAKSKHNGYEFVYQNPVVKPALVGLAGPWVSGGIEFNWAQHHRPTTFAPVEATVQNNPDGSVTCWLGEAEPFHRLRGAVGITLYPGKSYLEAKALLYNRTDLPLPFMWWNNLAVRVNPQYKAVFPPDVEYVSDHDRRAVISFPVMRGIFETARPYDYGDGVDGTWYPNIKIPTSVMVMRGQSEMNFLGGYDFAKNAGTVTVADHYVSVGKKMWTWGDCEFGRAWCKNLTDNDDRYIELMTGVYTDNQPDFTYLMPGETKEFTQVWYPIQEIGEVANATIDGALSCRQEGRKLFLGAIATALFPNARLSVALDGKTIFEKTASVAPDRSCLAETVLPDGAEINSVRVALESAEGKELVSYVPVRRGVKKKPQARSIPPRPAEVKSIEELYLHGAHLEQYKHHTYKPEAYYLEALRRDPSDYRSNLALGRLCTEKAQFETARLYLNRAVAKLTCRNDNPSDTEAVYLLGRLEKLCGNPDAAYELFQRAAWQYPWRSQAYLEIARIDCARGEKQRAIHYLRLSLETNAKLFAARTLLGYLLQDKKLLESVLTDAPQDTFARFALYLLGGEEVAAFILHRPEDVLDVALEFKQAGLYQEAVRVLDLCQRPNLLLKFHKAALLGQPPEDATLDYCFPNRLEDLAVLAGRNDWRAAYLLGCLYYDRLNYASAADAWETSVRLHENNPYALRNLAFAYYDHLGRKQEALGLLQEALARDPQNARLLYELLQLKKNLGSTAEERLALLESHAALVCQRDDCYLSWAMLYTQTGQYEKAEQLLKTRSFHIYEGGEGMLTRHHSWLYTLMGAEAMREGNYEKAAKCFPNALAFPANYGEGKHYSAQESNVWYYAGLLNEQRHLPRQAKECYEQAVQQPPRLTEISYFTARAWEKLGQPEQAAELFRQMCAQAGERLTTADLPGYFGVGSPVPQPFELDLEKVNRVNAYLLLALGQKGLGNLKAAEACVQELVRLDPYNATLEIYRKLDVL